jgi:exopolyphosphatase/guanosine-5'-triphosphate,3'-diphosphate pyrophosphatase
MRIAAIDIGSNSIHMVIADTTAQGSFTVTEREREVVQIGRGSFESGRLQRDAIQRTVSVLARFVQLARRLQSDKIICTATAAVREARNGGEFLQLARRIAGVTPRVIPAEEEGRLIYLAVRAALPLDDKPVLIIDIGGGSAQFVVGDQQRLRLATSSPLGAVRLTEMMIDHDPPTRAEIQKLRRSIRKQAKPALEKVLEQKPERVYGTSGAIHALAEACHREKHGTPIEQINGYEFKRDDLAAFTRRLVRMPLAEREKLQGLDAKRAEIIVPGALVLLHVLDQVEAEAVILSDYGVREGLVTDYIGFHAAEITRLATVEDLRLRSVYALLDRFHADGAHPRHVARLALQLFDALRTAHKLPDEARTLLHYAALLHDIGSVIGFDGHAVHSAYVIRHGNLRGLTAREVGVVANVARYHSKAKPRKRDEEFAALDKPDRRLVRWLAAILRVAEALDRSHYQLVRSLTVRRRGRGVMIHVAARRDVELELWAARRRVGLLERMLGTKSHPGRVMVSLAPAAPRRSDAADSKPATGTHGASDGQPARRRVTALRVVTRP